MYVDSVTLNAFRWQPEKSASADIIKKTALPGNLTHIKQFPLPWKEATGMWLMATLSAF